MPQSGNREELKDTSAFLDNLLALLVLVLKEGGVTHAYMEKRLGWSGGTFTRLMTGERRLRVDQLLAILAEIGVKASLFFSLAEEHDCSQGSPQLKLAIVKALTEPALEVNYTGAAQGQELDVRIERIVRRVLKEREQPDRD